MTHGARLVALGVALFLGACQSAQTSGTPIVTETPTGPVSSTAPPAPLSTPSTTAGQPTPPATANATPAFGTQPTGPTQVAQVARVVDGDTIHVLLDGVDYPLRYIGMDTPEEFDPNSPVEPLSRDAQHANERLVKGREVILEKDVSETDRFDRLLRYVWLHDQTGWLMVNLELVREGYAQAKAYPPDVKYQSLLDAAQASAQGGGLGIWGLTAPSSQPSSPGGSQCDPAYPSVCIPPPPPDLDCADIPYRRFTVLPPDPHRFDGDHNGIGCESG